MEIRYLGPIRVCLNDSENRENLLQSLKNGLRTYIGLYGRWDTYVTKRNTNYWLEVKHESKPGMVYLKTVGYWKLKALLPQLLEGEYVPSKRKGWEVIRCLLLDYCFDRDGRVIVLLNELMYSLDSAVYEYLPGWAKDLITALTEYKEHKRSEEYIRSFRSKEISEWLKK